MARETPAPSALVTRFSHDNASTRMDTAISHVVTFFKYILLPPHVFMYVYVYISAITDPELPPVNATFLATAGENEDKTGLGSAFAPKKCLRKHLSTAADRPCG